MAHPLIPQVLELATPVAGALGLEVVGAVFQTNQNPPVLRFDVRHQEHSTSLDDCEQMSRALETALDEAGIIPDAYVLEVSSPGLSDQLETDQDFAAFKGFTVIVSLRAPLKGQHEWVGRLVGRDAEAVKLNLKGRAIALPRDQVVKVQLTSEE